MKILIFFSAFLLQICLRAQNKEIEIIEERGASTIKLFAVNTTTEDLELTFGIQFVGFTVSEKIPVSKLLKPGVKEYLLTLSAPNGVDCEYQTSVTYKKLRKPQNNLELGNDGVIRTTGIKLNPDKINVFTQDGCSRCKFIISYLEENKIPFVELNTSLHQPNQDLMFSKLEEVGFKGSNVQMPVIVSKGKTDYNISSLADYTNKIK